MASLQKRLPTNVAGDLYVDETCIDCDTCRWMAPETFDRAGEQSRVFRQPADEHQRRAALMALVACPTASIGTVERPDLRAVQGAFPTVVDGPVHHCGYHAESSFGAASYLILREGGNVLVDSPRFAGPLVRRLEELGGVATLFLTHRDDVADHRRFAEHFGCRRVLHVADRTADTADVELLVEGTDPVPLDDDLLVLPTPGHTRGSACLLHRRRHLFSGDHLAWSPRLGHVYGFRGACWHDWSELIASTRRLAAHRFEWILPGHGRRCHLPADEMARQLQRCLAWMEGVA